MKRRRFQAYDPSVRGLTKLERQMGGNSREDREMIANAASLPHGRHYRQAMDDIDAGVKPKAIDADTDKTK